MLFFAVAAPICAAWYFGVNYLASGLRHIQAAYPSRSDGGGERLPGQYVRFRSSAPFYSAPFYLATVTLTNEGFTMSPPRLSLRWRTAFFVPWGDVRVVGQRVVLRKTPKVSITRLAILGAPVRP
jgi:hypothetical protein